MRKKLRLRISEGVLRDYRTLLSIALPLMGGSVSGVIIGVVDTAFLGRYGEVGNTLAGAGIGIQIVLGLSIVAVASMVGQAVLSAHSFGANHPKRVGVVLWHSALLFLTIGVLLTAALNIWAHQIVGIFTDSAVVAETAVEYLRVGSFLTPILIGHILLVNVFAADKKPLYLMFSHIVLAIFNIGLSYPLIFGVGPFPELGVMGSALGSVLAEIAALAFMVVVFVWKGYHRRIRPTTFRISPRFMRSLIWLSLPTMLSVLFLHLGEFNAVRVAGLIGDSELATIRVVNIMVFSTFALMYGFAQTGQVMAGRLLGAGDWAGVKRIYRRNFELLVMSYVPLMAVYLAIPALVLSIATGEANLIGAGVTPLRIGAIGLLAVTWTLNSVVFIRGVGKTHWDLLMNGVSALAVQIPLAYVFALVFGWGLNGLYVSTFLFWLVRGIIGFGLLMNLFRRDSYELKPATTLSEVFADD